MWVTSPDRMAEFAKLASVSVIAAALAAGTVLVCMPEHAPAAADSAWETERCQSVEIAIARQIPIREIAAKVESHSMSPLDAQCLMDKKVPREIWMAALRSVARNHPRYAESLSMTPGS